MPFPAVNLLLASEPSMEANLSRDWALERYQFAEGESREMIQEFGGLEYRPGALDLKHQHLVAWAAALLTDCYP
jgi:hypothetical protein